MRARLDLAYRGTDFSGWARQPGLRSVQGTLEDALGTVLRTEPPRLTVAGRTDAGVHARGQVAHVDLDDDVWLSVVGRSGRAPGDALVTRLAGVLPPDLVVRSVMPAPAGFDARFSALRRRYAYRVADQPEVRDPLTATHVLAVRRPLDVAAMDRALAPLVGLHDFASYCRPRPGATTIRELQEMSWRRVEDGPEAGLVVANVQADAFCHNMVRALVGASLAVGEGRRPESWPLELLRERSRVHGPTVVAPHGLVLEEIVYPPDTELAARAERVRAKRLDEEVLDATGRVVTGRRDGDAASRVPPPPDGPAGA